jgi:fatty-acyl-CoA synthase
VPATDDELAAHCRERLARFKVPKSFHVVDELPRNSLGKVVKSELRPVVRA